MESSGGCGGGNFWRRRGIDSEAGIGFVLEQDDNHGEGDKAGEQADECCDEKGATLFGECRSTFGVGVVESRVGVGGWLHGEFGQGRNHGRGVAVPGRPLVGNCIQCGVREIVAADIGNGCGVDLAQGFSEGFGVGIAGFVVGFERAGQDGAQRSGK